MLGALVTILTVILVFICLLMSLVILMQRPKQEGLGAAFGGALTDRMLGSGTTDFLQKATVYMGVAFFLLSLTIATLMAYDRNADRQSLSGEVKDTAEENAAAEEPTTNDAPLDPTATTPPSIDLDADSIPGDLGDVPPLDMEPPAEGIDPLELEVETEPGDGGDLDGAPPAEGDEADANEDGNVDTAPAANEAAESANDALTPPPVDADSPDTNPED